VPGLNFIQDTNSPEIFNGLPHIPQVNASAAGGYLVMRTEMSKQLQYKTTDIWLCDHGYCISRQTWDILGASGQKVKILEDTFFKIDLFTAIV
jgi:hypothetical protein